MSRLARHMPLSLGGFMPRRRQHYAARRLIDAATAQPARRRHVHGRICRQPPLIAADDAP